MGMGIARHTALIMKLIESIIIAVIGVRIPNRTRYIESYHMPHIIRSRPFLARNNCKVSIKNTMFFTKPASREIVSLNIIHKQGVDYIDILSLRPCHNHFRIGIVGGAAMDMVVSGKPASLSHILPAAGKYGFLYRLISCDMKGLANGVVLYATTHNNLPFPGRNIYGETFRNTPGITA